MFINTYGEGVKKSDFVYSFYLYLIDKLYKEYSSRQIVGLNGLPSAQSVKNVYEHLQSLSKENIHQVVELSIREKKKNTIQKQIYTTYKAASYYVNMAKDKLGVVTENNELGDDGKKLLKMRSGFFEMSAGEKEIYFRRLLEVDSLMIMTIPLFMKLIAKNGIDDYQEFQLEFLSKYYKVRYSYFTSVSLGNYETVRNYWIKNLDLLDKNLNIRKRYLDIVYSNTNHKTLYDDILVNFEDYKNNDFKNRGKYNKYLEMFEFNYAQNINKGNADGGYVNLYDIKEGMRLSDSSFEDFLNNYNQRERRTRRIFFSNLVNSIDRRRRFEVKGVPVLKIKIKKI